MKCPFCGAELAENSRFCLYCMKPLNDKEVVKSQKKKKWWLIILTAILLLIIGLGAWFLVGNGDNKPVNNETPNIIRNEEVLAGEEEENSNDLPEEKISDNKSDDKNKTEEPSEENLNSNEEQTEEEGTTENPEAEKEESTSSDNNSSSGNNSATVSTTKKPTTTITTTTTTTAPIAQPETIENVTWNYRAAYSSDYDKRYNKVEAADAITIIGFANIPFNGVFKIPETIDGKTVVAINMSAPQGYTFNAPAVKNKVKKVYLPPKLNKIAVGTFSECVNLTDLYIAGDYLYADPSVFPEKSDRTGKLTIHTSENSWCLYGSKYFDVYCSAYGANEYYAAWEEWNGDVYD